MDSFIVMAGKIVGIRLASILLPEPGGPIRMTLCPPAAAISRALFASFCPLTCEKSIKLFTLGVVSRLDLAGAIFVLPVRCAYSLFMLSTG